MVLIISPVHIGTRLKRLRLARQLSQRALAKKVGVSQAFIGQLETGTEDNPTLATLRKLAKALKVTPSTLLADERDRAMANLDRVIKRAQKLDRRVAFNALLEESTTRRLSLSERTRFLTVIMAKTASGEITPQEARKLTKSLG